MECMRALELDGKVETIKPMSMGHFDIGDDEPGPSKRRKVDDGDSSSEDDSRKEKEKQKAKEKAKEKKRRAREKEKKEKEKKEKEKKKRKREKEKEKEKEKKRKKKKEKEKGKVCLEQAHGMLGLIIRNGQTRTMKPLVMVPTCGQSTTTGQSRNENDHLVSLPSRLHLPAIPLATLIPTLTRTTFLLSHQTILTMTTLRSNLNLQDYQ